MNNTITQISSRKYRLKDAILSLEKNLKPGDVINIDGYDGIWPPWISITHKCIRAHQKHLFGPISDYRDTHTTMFFERDKIFSVTSPKALWENIEQQATQRFTVFRYTKRQFDNKDLSIMLSTANRIIGTKYDYGQLLDIALSQILGYEHLVKYSWFDMGKRRMVCSVGVRTIMENLRYVLSEQHGLNIHDPGPNPPMNRLFNKLNPAYWSIKEIDTFTRTDVGATSPAHFACSRWFEGEYEKILTWKMFL